MKRCLFIIICLFLLTTSLLAESSGSPSDSELVQNTAFAQNNPSASDADAAQSNPPQSIDLAKTVKMKTDAFTAKLVVPGDTANILYFYKNHYDSHETVVTVAYGLQVLFVEAEKNVQTGKNENFITLKIPSESKGFKYNSLKAEDYKIIIVNDKELYPPAAASSSYERVLGGR
ncbi:hypothetical protein Emin_1316 [Elusimicrobium minutum Pei191]|uniref:Uncharacterized protein n=1 Tax=Elusimicrobium minutum (strain Pei191) TaxID=445932 RepID=B2KEC0_ELUMP|nr:hypothetical protein [Elusimicrobium minutum]ACC98866.1 hypothetical protein Emin_1316 [Elusimicrobium minutum Pei191]